jgi:hypothetical protein
MKQIKLRVERLRKRRKTMRMSREVVLKAVGVVKRKVTVLNGRNPILSQVKYLKTLTQTKKITMVIKMTKTTTTSTICKVPLE